MEHSKYHIFCGRDPTSENRDPEKYMCPEVEQPDGASPPEMTWLLAPSSAVLHAPLHEGSAAGSQTCLWNVLRGGVAKSSQVNQVELSLPKFHRAANA